MNHQKNYYRIYWEKNTDHQARILRIFGTLPTVTVPSFLEDYPVTELGNYCFAKTCRLPDKYFTTDLNKTPNSIYTTTELCGSYIESIQLPDTLKKIGDYAFYDCRNLSQITFGSQLQSIGSDAFMNCHSLHQLSVNCSVTEKTGLRQILSQISWNIEVHFLKNAAPDTYCVQAAVFFPEYYETYDEIAPAHIFGRGIVGEGFRARQSFRDGIIDFIQYDTILKKACAEESEQTMCHIALCRLRYPFALSDEKKDAYLNYIRTHGEILCHWLIDNRKLDALSFLFQNNCLMQKDIQYAVALAAQTGWSEGNASMLRWKYNSRQKEPTYPTRYEFEDF